MFGYDDCTSDNSERQHILYDGKLLTDDVIEDDEYNMNRRYELELTL